MSVTLAFNDYYVLESIYRSNPFIEEEEEGEEETFRPRFSVEIGHPEDDIKKASINLSIELGDKDVETTPYYVKAKILGIFSVTLPNEGSEDLTDDDITRYYRINGLAIMYPYLRSLVSDISSKGSETPIILPPANIRKMMQDQENNSDE